MARLSAAEKKIETDVDAAFSKIGSNRRFDIMDLGKIHDAGVQAGLAGLDIEAAVKAACERYEIKEAA